MTDDDFALTSPVPVEGRARGLDHWPTPRWVTLALVRHAEARGWWERGDHVLDPCCGEGELLDVLHEAGLVTHGLELDRTRATLAMRRGHRLEGIGDAIELPWRHTSPVVGTRFPLLVMNPPFSAAEAFVRRGLAERPARGLVLALLRLSWLEPAGERGELFAAHPPDVLVLPRRPRYDGKGHDNVTSAWFVWPGTGQIVWLPG